MKSGALGNWPDEASTNLFPVRGGKASPIGNHEVNGYDERKIMASLMVEVFLFMQIASR